MASSAADIEQRKAADPKASVWVAASAGTGKTKVLTDRVLSLMVTGTKPTRILSLTFTKAAAAEMAIRINEVLGKWARMREVELGSALEKLLGRPAADEERARARMLFAAVLDAPGGMNIQTIHAFCQSLLRRFPVEADLAPQFQVMDDRDAAVLLEAAREQVLMSAQAGTDPDLAQALAAVTERIHESTFAELMADLAADRGRWRLFLSQAGGINAAVQMIEDALAVRAEETPESVLAEACKETALDVLGLRLALSGLLAGSKTDVARAEPLQRFLETLEADRPPLFPAYQKVFLTDKGEPRKTQATKSAEQAAPGAGDIMTAEALRLIRVSERLKAVITARSTAALLRIGDALLSAYDEAKRRRGLLDYDDLILITARLLSDQGVAPWVLYKLDGGLDHILIDEAQDTNPDQWRVVRELGREFYAGFSASEVERTVFAVGDLKQSIYSFQRADPQAFLESRAFFEGLAQASAKTWRDVGLNLSFRSTEAVLRGVDAVFSAGRDEGVALDGQPIRHQAFRAGQAGLIELWPTEKPLTTEPSAAWKPPVERLSLASPEARLAGRMAAKIRSMIRDGDTLPARGRSVRAGDIMVLVRRRTGFVEELVRALKAADVAVTGVDRMVLVEQIAVMDLVALGRFVLLPEDDLTLACVLKGPLIGLSEDELFQVAYDRGKLSLWQSLRAKASADEGGAFARAANWLSDRLAEADYRPPYEFFSHVLGPLEGRRKLLGRLGPEAEDPIGEFLDLALRYERTNTPGLEGFLHWLEVGSVEIKRDLEQEGEDAVRILTVHGSKGLQAPIVFLPDTAQVPNRTPKVLWRTAFGEAGEEPAVPLWSPRREHEPEVVSRLREGEANRRDEEYARLLYVALTRAEDRLYVAGWQGQKNLPEHSWYARIQEAWGDLLTPHPEETDAGDEPIRRMTRPQEVEPSRETLTDIGPKRLDVPDWARTPPAPEADPPQPLSPSAEDGPEPPARSPFDADGNRRFLRGRLIHRLLQSLPDLDPEARAEACARFLERPHLELSAEEQREIATETLSVMSLGEAAPLFGPGSRAEVPIAGLVGNRAFTGRVDRLLVTPGAVHVLDFKTNRPPPRLVDDVAPVYLGQMAAYRAALRLIYPDRPVSCSLLWTDVPLLMPLPDPLLDGRVAE
ncbi:MAG: double-strand break repair helicase AddA [Magnetovibrionaceae bacterium]